MIDNMAVMLTTRCQLACRYCFLARRQKDMTLDTMRRSLDLLFTSKSKRVELQFFGGEPLLRFDLIKKAYAYAKTFGARKKSIKYLLTTNGILLDRKKMQYFKSRKTTIMFSMDGCLKTQNDQRPSILKKNAMQTTEKILDNLKYLVDYYPDYFVNLVFFPGNSGRLPQDVEFLLKLGVKDLQLSYAIGFSYSHNDLKNFKKALIQVWPQVVKYKARIRNFSNNSEPVLLSPQLNISCRGDIYVGCAFVLEERLPFLNKLFYAGCLDKTRSLSEIERSRCHQKALLLKHRHELSETVFNNINFGLALRSIFTKRNFVR